MSKVLILAYLLLALVMVVQSVCCFKAYKNLDYDKLVFFGFAEDCVALLFVFYILKLLFFW